VGGALRLKEPTMRQRLYPSNAARQKAYRDRNRNAGNRNAHMQLEVARLAPRFLALDPRWALGVSDDGKDELELIGNGPPAAWITVDSCEVWLERRERYRKQHKRRQEPDEEAIAD